MDGWIYRIHQHWGIHFSYKQINDIYLSLNILIYNKCRSIIKTHFNT